MQRDINAFVNHKGGRLFFGVTHQGSVRGLYLDSDRRLRIRSLFADILCKMYPKVWGFANYGM